MKKIIIPSIIAKDQKELDKRLKKVINHFEIFQLDIMDGIFVKNKSLYFDFKLPKNNKKYEAHLMVKNPSCWVEKYGSRVNTIIFHIESLEKKEVLPLIHKIKKKRKKVGIAINPKTPLEAIKPYIKKIDMVTIMTVYPGKYGSNFLPSQLKKVSFLSRLKKGPTIEVDGGIKPQNMKAVKEAGANKLIMGSYLQKSKNIKNTLSKLNV